EVVGLEHVEVRPELAQLRAGRGEHAAPGPFRRLDGDETLTGPMRDEVLGIGTPARRVAVDHDGDDEIAEGEFAEPALRRLGEGEAGRPAAVVGDADAVREALAEAGHLHRAVDRVHGRPDRPGSAADAVREAADGVDDHLDRAAGVTREPLESREAHPFCLRVDVPSAVAAVRLEQWDTQLRALSGGHPVNEAANLTARSRG